MSDYTPTTERVRNHYAGVRVQGGSEYTTADAEFYRWLARHDAEVAAKAWDEGAAHAAVKQCRFARDGDPCPYNPYREAGI